MIATPTEDLTHGVNAAVFAFLAGKSAHSDIVSPLWTAVKDLPGARIYCADKQNFGYVVVCANCLAFAFAEGMHGVTLRLPPTDAEQLLAQGAETRPDIGPEWLFFPLFWHDNFQTGLEALASKAFAYTQPPSSNSFKPKPVRGSA